ncbi:hypothetical protein SAMN05444349_103202 [Bacteroides faecichinchillae]|uniref:Uncharacterized protein n=1 Tax=Bacteroides faecichinchillae TaxID=871325 RepID=A0A1M4ULW2_9BACE|nr:hypothetical protein SAMN05444349_103202 [Bacteroides faecichinchillae]
MKKGDNKTMKGDNKTYKFLIITTLLSQILH